MTTSSRLHRRTLLMGLAALAPAVLAGCASPSSLVRKDDGTYCHQARTSYRTTLTCTQTAVPSDAAEADAKRFVAEPASLTVYVLRRHWADASVIVPVTVNGSASLSTIPSSLVRLRLKPGSHRLSAMWDGKATDVLVEGDAGELQVIDLVGSFGLSVLSLKWQVSPGEDVRRRAMASKLIADLDLRG